ncbi:hypothetical protein PG999_007425 [Apiospora kogelbergensis]|uniref:Uncharacterized protein n=1 Tax=Apiospora kogelbergensis TaxID=1337665 RepID=A0AAW0QYD2_9PEZI
MIQSGPTQQSTDSAVPEATSFSPGHRDTGGSPHTSQSFISNYGLTHSNTRLTQTWNDICKVYNAKGRMLLKLLATILGLLFAALTIWPGYSSANDGHKAELIAEWTARKDFIEACETLATKSKEYNWMPP